MRIAHISDLHVLAMDALRPQHMFGKRLTGYANLKLKRTRHHTQERLDRVAAGLRDLAPDHLVVTGDLTNLALEAEFERVGFFLRGLGIDASRITVVPGNHDAYTQGSYKSQYLPAFLPEFLQADIQVAPHKRVLNTFPFVRLLGSDVALLALCSAVPRLPFVAAGQIGAPQLSGVSELLAHPSLSGRKLFVLVHHPLHMPEKGSKRWFESLRDAAALVGTLTPHAQFVVLHGHLHRRMTHRTDAYVSYGATSASNEHHDGARDAAINVYDLAADGSIDAWAQVWDASGQPARDTLEHPSVW